MKLIARYPKIIYIISAITLFIFISGSQSTAKKGVSYKEIGQLKSKPKIQLTTPLVMVTTPIQIKNLAPSWRDAELIVESMAYFVSEKGPVGYSIGKVSKPNALTNGSYQGTVKVSASEVHGDVTNMYVTISVALARKGDQCKVLGFGCHGIGSGGSSDCISDEVLITDAARPYTDPFLPDFIQSLQQ